MYHDTSFDAASFRGGCLVRGGSGVYRLLRGRSFGTRFTMEDLSTNGGNTTRFADPNDRVKNFVSQGSRPFGQRANDAVRCRPTL